MVYTLHTDPGKDPKIRPRAEKKDGTKMMNTTTNMIDRMDTPRTDTGTRKKNTRAADLLYRRAMEYFGTERVERALRYSIMEYSYLEYFSEVKWYENTDFDECAIIAHTIQAISHIDALLKKGIKNKISKDVNNKEEIYTIEDSGLANYQDNSINFDDPQETRVNYITIDEKIRIPEKAGQDALSQLIMYATEYWNSGTIKEIDTYHNKEVQYSSIATAFLNWAKRQYNQTHINAVGMEDPDSDCTYDIQETVENTASFVREEWDERERIAHSTIIALCRAYHIQEKLVYDCICEDGNLNVRKARALRSTLERKREAIHIAETFPEKEYKPLVRLYSCAFGLGMEYKDSLEYSRLSPQFYTDTAKAVLNEILLQKKARKAGRDKELAALEAGTLPYSALSAEARRELSRRRRREKIPS